MRTTEEAPGAIDFTSSSMEKSIINSLFLDPHVLAVTFWPGVQLATAMLPGVC